MSERKVVNKYYPPDFDPTKLKIIDKKTNRKICNVRMMLPMTLKCYTCNQYMYIGTKFNMKVETVLDEDYLGIKIHRFYFKCSNCYSIITFKTDPKNNDYVAEWGASRNHEPWKDMLLAEEEYEEFKKQEMKEDVMKSLEYRTYDSKREMDILDSIDQVKNLNKGKINYNEIINNIIKDEENKKKIIDSQKEEIKKIYMENKTKYMNNNNLVKDINNNNLLTNNKSEDIFFLNKKVLESNFDKEININVNKKNESLTNNKKKRFKIKVKNSE